MLKQLLQLLLNTRTTPSEAGHSAMPSVSLVDIPSVDPNVINISLSKTESEEWARFALYTAPTDGYIQFQGRAISEEAYMQCDALWIPPYKRTQIRGFLPIAKGNTVSLSGENLKNVTAIFIAAIGGGCNGFVWRALPCLRPSFNYLPKVFSRVNPSGLHHKVFQKGEYSCRQHLPNTFLHKMDTLESTRTPQTQDDLLTCMPLTKLIQFFPGFAWGLLGKLLRTHKSFLSEKGARSLSLTIRIQSKNYGFRRLLEVINNMRGGALC